ncbi:MAG: TIGR00730 family Rossman fold protein [Alphaproteobacteria bacterium]|nr:TIGR00730 family Rossman fold protein [Alphaproteobacteria bacterium]NCB49970.1 TIGR00730 family Rossman fold protein [Alphaproteobacteria bacterium]
MTNKKSICVFCGSAEGNDPSFKKEAYHFGNILAENNISLIYGAGGIGLMNAVFRGCKDKGGYVIGATIQRLYDIEKPDISLSEIDEIKIFNKMSERKVFMCKKADAICILPGGLGTLDEFFEILTLKQLNISDLPIILLNTNGFFDPIRMLIDSFIEKGFIKPKFAHLFKLVDKADDILPTLLEDKDFTEK